MNAPDRIWLEPECAGDEQCWSSKPLDDCGEEGCLLPSTEYIRADISEAEKRQAVREALELLVEMARNAETAALRAYPEWPSNPLHRMRYDQDMDPVRRARALIARIDAEEPKP